MLDLQRLFDYLAKERFDVAMAFLMFVSDDDVSFDISCAIQGDILKRGFVGSDSIYLALAGFITVDVQDYMDKVNLALDGLGSKLA